MALKAFECKSCGVVVFIPETESKLPWCSICRGKTFPINIQEETLVEYRCTACGLMFYHRAIDVPYKCPKCNFTIVTFPNRIMDERY